MNIQDKHRSRWWLAGALIALLVTFPVLMIGFFALNNFAGAILGPPAIWQRTRHSPPRTDFVGHYKESDRHWAGTNPSSPATLDLRSDGTLTVHSLSTDTGFKNCVLSGTGRWVGPDDDQRLMLTVTSDGGPGSCSSDSYSGMQLVHQSKPYGFYWILGDPDSGEGVWLTKQ